MHTRTKHLGILVLAMASVIAIALGAASALADPAPWWQTPDQNTLTVAAVDGESDMATDVATCNVAVDVYRIAIADPNPNYQAFDYTPVEPFAELAIPADPTAEDWQALADQAAAIVLPEGASAFAVEPYKSGTAGQAMSGMEDGLYLVLAHGQGVTNGFTAVNGDYTKEYTFQPTIVALPGTASGTTADPSGWISDVAIALKPEAEPLYGDISISKTLTGFVGTEPAMFTFHIESTPDSPYEYANDKSITFTGAGTDVVLDTHIKAGTIVTVTEVHEGTRYQLVTGDTSPKTIVSNEAIAAGAATSVPEAAFTNEPSDETKQGHGIENKFELSKTGEADSDWDWVWTQIPDSEATE